MTDANEITVWLAVIGIASVLQVLLLISAGVVAAVTFRRASRTVERVRVETLEPVVQRVNVVLDDLHDVAGRVQAVDAQVREAMSRTTDTVGNAASLVSGKFWPVVGLARAVRAAFSRTGAV